MANDKTDAEIDETLQQIQSAVDGANSRLRANKNS